MVKANIGLMGLRIGASKRHESESDLLGYFLVRETANI